MNQVFHDPVVKPNVIVGSLSHIAIGKSIQACDLEAKIVQATEKSNYSFDSSQMEDYLDQNTGTDSSAVPFPLPVQF